MILLKMHLPCLKKINNMARHNPQKLKTALKNSISHFPRFIQRWNPVCNSKILSPLKSEVYKNNVVHLTSL